jgi:hypothetical protein
MSNNLNFIPFCKALEGLRTTACCLVYAVSRRIRICILFRHWMQDISINREYLYVYFSSEKIQFLELSLTALTSPLRPTIAFFFFVASGVGLSPLYCGHFWPVVPAPDDRWGWLWNNWWNKDWDGKPKYSEKTCPSATLPTTNPTWSDPGSNPGRRGGKPATNRLSYGAAHHRLTPASCIETSLVHLYSAICVRACVRARACAPNTSGTSWWIFFELVMNVMTLEITLPS